MSDDLLQHIGMPRRSGRYPWGSGDDPYQRSMGFRGHVHALRKQGLSDVQIAEHEGIKTTQLRARLSISRAEERAAKRVEALRLYEKDYSKMEIGRRMGLNESTVRSLLDPALAEKARITRATSDMLKENVDKKRFIDIGTGVENYIGVSRTKLNTAVEELKEAGYKVHTINVPQLGMPGKFTIVKVLGAPDTEWKEIVKPENFDKIQTITAYSNDHGRSFRTDLGLKPPQSVSSERVQVRYADEGGRQKDGVIELRRDVKDLDLGKSRYAQVRIAVDDNYYLKGMAIYSDDMPAGIDIVYNTNKQDTGNKTDAMKRLKRDKDGNIEQANPFGSTIKPNGQRGAINVVNEEGDWEKWTKTISSQILSKQTPPLAKKQLDLAFKQKKETFDEIMELTNPVVKKQLLLAFADDCDSSSVHLKAAALPRQASKVILPIPTMKSTEVYAPTFNDGEQVVLIRHPHGGRFEIAQLKVNNKVKAAQAVMKGASDAIGINPTVAQKLSGADFDGDAVIVIPNNRGHIKTSASLKGLQDFDPITAYPPHDGMRTIDGGIYNSKTREVEYPKRPDGRAGIPKTQTRQTRMGEVSNLITDMTIKGASFDELARAVRHSMVVIDSEKHNLNYKESYKQNGIASLSQKYQNSARGGASTLISKASSEIRVPHRRSTPKIDPITGAKVYDETGQTYVDDKGRTVRRTTPSTMMAETLDARTLSSGRPIEEVYANYANNLKALANTSRRNALGTKPTPYSPSAKKIYEKEVANLTAQLNIAFKNKPLERQAQLLANSVVARKKEAHPNMEQDDIKKLRNQALAAARVRTRASKYHIKISDREWEAIQAGAITPSKLTQILQNTDLDRVKQLATPRATTSMTPVKVSRAKTLLAAGHTQAEVAANLGVSVATLSKSL